MLCTYVLFRPVPLPDKLITIPTGRRAEEKEVNITRLCFCTFIIYFTHEKLFSHDELSAVVPLKLKSFEGVLII